MMILEEIASHNGLLTLSDIGRSLKMALPTVCGFIASLEKWDLIRRNEESGRFFLGSKIVQLGSYCDVRRIQVELIHPYLVNLSRTFDETVHLAFPEGNGILYQDKVESTHPLRMTSMVGTRETYFQSALGLALAAATPGLTLTQEEHALIEKHCRERTAVLFHADMGLYCLGTAVTNSRNQALAGLSMAIPECRFSVELESQVLTALTDIADELRERV